MSRRPGWLVPLALLALALLALLAWLAMRGSDDSGKKVAETRDGSAVTVAQLVEDDGAALVGEQIAIVEEIDEVINDSSFLFGGDSDELNIPVVGVRDDMFVDSNPKLEPLLRARIEGEVVRFDQDQFVAAYGNEFADPQYAEFEGKAAIVASSIDIDPADDGGTGEDNGNG